MSRRSKSKSDPFRYFNSSPEVIRLVVMIYVRFPLSLRNVEDLLFERGIDICHETVRLWWNRFGPLFAADIRRQQVERMRGFRHWRWYLDEVFVRINGERHYLWRAVDHEGERYCQVNLPASQKPFPHPDVHAAVVAAAHV
jgi:putative transposase